MCRKVAPNAIPNFDAEKKLKGVASIPLAGLNTCILQNLLEKKTYYILVRVDGNNNSNVYYHTHDALNNIHDAMCDNIHLIYY